GLTLAVALSPATPFAGTRNVSLAFRVVAADSGKPIAWALVRIVPAFDERPGSAARTDGDGRARLNHGFKAWGQRRAFRTARAIAGTSSPPSRWPTSAPPAPGTRRVPPSSGSRSSTPTLRRPRRGVD